MNIYQVEYTNKHGNVEITLIVLAEDKDSAIEHCFYGEGYEEIPREKFGIKEIYSPVGITPLPKTIYYHSEEQR